MTPIKTFKIGSQVFFEGMPDYTPKDIDELCIMDSFPFKENVMHANGLHGKDVFFYRNLNKEGFITDTISSDTPMKIGKMLVPEFAEWLGLTIDDLKKLSDIVDKIDDKHSYEKIIYNSYLSNGNFLLTDEQREEAYKEYKKYR